MSEKPKKEGIGVEGNVHSPMKGASYMFLAILDANILWAWTVSGVTGVREGRTRSLDPFERLCNHGGESSDRTVKIKEVSLVTVFPFPKRCRTPEQKAVGAI